MGPVAAGPDASNKEDEYGTGRPGGEVCVDNGRGKECDRTGKRKIDTVNKNMCVKVAGHRCTGGRYLCESVNSYLLYSF